MPRIKGLDSIRAIGFLIVFFVHTGFLNVGWIMQVFFVLSGYLITAILINMKRTLPKKEFFIKFYGRRTLRIFPLYYFYLLVALPIIIIAAKFGNPAQRFQQLADMLPSALAYVYNFVSITSSKPFPIMQHLWTLCVEEQFYLIWPLVIFITPEKNYKKLFLWAIVLGPAFRIAFLLAYNAGLLASLNLQAGVPGAIFILPFSHLDAFGMGAYISQFTLPNPKRNFAILSFVIPILGILNNYLAIGKFAYLGSLGYPYLMESGNQFLWGYSVFNYWSALLICAILQEGAFQKFLSWSPLIYLGKISYGLYVYHLGIILLISRAFERMAAPASPALLAGKPALELIAVIVAASLSYHYFEIPILNLKNKFFRIAGDPPYGPPTESQVRKV